MTNRNHGGKRENAGRKPGSVNTLTAMKDQVEEDHPNFNLVSWLVSVVKDTDVPIGTRVLACNSAIKYIYPPAQSEEPILSQVQITGFEVVEDDG
nr:hypothetical protein [Rhodospirillales bacterium]